MWQRHLVDRRLREKEGEGGDDGGGGDRGNVKAALEGFVSKFADAKAAAAQLFDENHSLREDKRKLRSQLEKAVPEGAVVLQGDDATAWQAYQELGKPDDLKAAIERRDELESLEKDRGKAEARAAAAEVARFKADVLSELPGVSDLEFEVREEGDEEVAYVTAEGEKPQKLDEYAKEKWSKFLPALQADADAGGDGAGGKNAFPDQKSRGGRGQEGPKAPKDIVQDKLKSGAYRAL